MASNSALLKLFDDFWKWRMYSTPEFATMVGDKSYDDQLEHFTMKRFQSDYEKCEEFLKQVEEIEHSKLNENDRLNLNLFRAELLTFSNGYRFQGFLFPISFLEGIHVDFQRISGWMTFERKKDYENLINRYKIFPLLVDEIIEMLRVAVKEKMTNHAHSMEGVVDKFYNHADDNISTESTEFYKPFLNITLDNNLIEEDIKKLRSMAADAIRYNIRPAMLKMAEFLKDEYLPKTRPDIAATSLPSGEEYYKACLKFHTSTDLSAKQIHEIGLAEVERIENNVKMIIVNELKKDGMDLKEFFKALRNEKKFFFDSPEKLVNHFKRILNEKIDPKLESIFCSAPKLPLEVVEIPEHMGGGPAAYYIAGTADGSRAGKFFVNTKRYDSQPSYECISLALHEGNPGHHLQSSYSMVTEPPLPAFRQVMEDRSYFLAPSRFPINTAFVEGWALYCENLGDDLHLYNDPYDRIGHYSMEMVRACRLVVDTGMHALGWSREQAVKFMKEHTASSEENINSEINRYITWPGQAVGYKIGEIKIKELRKDAEDKLGELFDLRQFHEVVLKSAGPMDIVDHEVKCYIEKVLANK